VSKDKPQKSVQSDAAEKGTSDNPFSLFEGFQFDFVANGVADKYFRGKQSELSDLFARGQSVKEVSAVSLNNAFNKRWAGSEVYDG